MNQSILVQAQVDKSAEVCDIAHHAADHHAWFEIFDVEDLLVQLDLGQIIARVAPRPGQGIEDIRQGILAKLKLS